MVNIFFNPIYDFEINKDLVQLDTKLHWVFDFTEKQKKNKNTKKIYIVVVEDQSDWGRDTL